MQYLPKPRALIFLVLILGVGGWLAQRYIPAIGGADGLAIYLFVVVMTILVASRIPITRRVLQRINE